MVVDVRLEGRVKWQRAGEAYQSSALGEEGLGCGDGLYDFEGDLSVEICYGISLGE